MVVGCNEDILIRIVRGGGCLLGVRAQADQARHLGFEFKHPSTWVFAIEYIG